MQATLDFNDDLNLVLRPNELIPEQRPDRVDRALGASEIKWEGTTGEYMELVRKYSDDSARCKRYFDNWDVDPIWFLWSGEQVRKLRENAQNNASRDFEDQNHSE